MCGPRAVVWCLCVVLALAVPEARARNAPPSSPLLPDSTLTPGDVLPVGPRDICTPGYAKKVRHVPIAIKRAVYAKYRIHHHGSGQYEVDHLISLELGGSNSIRNLWPQSYMTRPWNAYVKDKLENELHRLVCAGRLDLATAQREIASDWIAAYKEYFPDAPPGSRSRPAPHHRNRTQRH